MKRSLLFGIALALTLTGCENQNDSGADQPPPRPALWEVTTASAGPQGDEQTVEGWLFGTIHALPDGANWETDLLAEKIANADMLVVEIAALEDDNTVPQIFARLAQTPGLPPLSQRLPPSEQDALTKVFRNGSYSHGDFTATESWAAALMLAQTISSGDPENGADRELLRRFRGKTVRELEGAERQLGIFDRLAEAEQRDLLSAVVKEAASGLHLSAELARSWRLGDMDRITQENTRGILADPELRAALLVNRNKDWAAQIGAMLPRSPPAFIAVGAAHMAGPDGLPALLEERGYVVTRIQ